MTRLEELSEREQADRFRFRPDTGNHMSAREEEYRKCADCPACTRPKSIGCVLCWACWGIFKYQSVTLDYFILFTTLDRIERRTAQRRAEELDCHSDADQGL